MWRGLLPGSAFSSLDKHPAFEQDSAFVATDADAPLDQLWKEYSLVFKEFDDLTLARWLAQTLSQVQGKAWRLSHPLLGAYRLAAQLGHERQIWFKRLTNPPPAYAESPCCRAPMLPLVTRDVREAGLICQHCSETLVPFDEIPGPSRVEATKDVGAQHDKTRTHNRLIERLETQLPDEIHEPDRHATAALLSKADRRS